MLKNTKQRSTKKLVSEVLNTQNGSARRIRNLDRQDYNPDERYRQLFESSDDGICLLDANSGRIEDLNSAALDLFGGRRENYLSKKIWETKLFLKTGLKKSVFDKIREKGRVRFKKIVLSENKGEKVFIELSAELFGSYEDRGIQCTFRDITHHQRTLILQEKDLKQKQVMLKELQHRTKNTFNLITGLIQLKSFDTDSPETKMELHELSLRVMAISDLYTLLYETDSHQKIDIDTYFQVVGDSIVGIQPEISINYHINKIELPAQKASSLGIILVELLYNSMKYAFPENRKGSIDICFWKNGNTFSLVVSDNGVGLPDDFKIVDTKSSGLRLVQLMADRLGGKCELSSHYGTEVIVEFSE